MTKRAEFTGTVARVEALNDTTDVAYFDEQITDYGPARWHKELTVETGFLAVGDKVTTKGTSIYKGV